MAAYKSRAFVRSKYDTPFYKTPLKWIPRSKSGASKSRPLWAAHTRIGNVWEYPPPGADITFVALFPSNHWLFIEKIVLDDSTISELEKP